MLMVKRTVVVIIIRAVAVRRMNRKCDPLDGAITRLAQNEADPYPVPTMMAGIASRAKEGIG